MYSLMFGLCASIRLICFALASGLLFGIDLGSIGGALHGMVQDFGLSAEQEQAVVSGTTGGAIAGCLLGGALMTAHGRRFTVALGTLPFFLGPALVMTSTKLLQLLVGRLVMGIGIGLASVAAPCYLSEVAPPQQRGLIVSMYELAIACGFLIASLANDLIEEFNVDGRCQVGCWRFQAGLVPVLAALPLSFAALSVPESPRWLISVAGSQRKAWRDALEAMHQLGCQGSQERLNATEEEEVLSQVNDDDLVCLWDIEHSRAGSPLFSSALVVRKPSEDLSYNRLRTFQVLATTVKDIYSILRNAEEVPTGTRHGMVLALLAAILNQVCASTSLLIYAQHLLEKLGVASAATQDRMAMVVVAAKFIGVIIGLLIVDGIGRRALLGWGGALSAFFILLLSIGAANGAVVVVLIGLGGFIFAFYVSWGIGYWVVVTELTTAGGQRYAAASQAAATATLFCAGWLTAFTFVSITDLGPWSLLTYMGMGILMTLYAVCLLPETRGRTLEDCTKVSALE